MLIKNNKMLLNFFLGFEKNARLDKNVLDKKMYLNTTRPMALFNDLGKRH